MLAKLSLHLRERQVLHFSRNKIWNYIFKVAVKMFPSLKTIVLSIASLWGRVLPFLNWKQASLVFVSSQTYVSNLERIRSHCVKIMELQHLTVKQMYRVSISSITIQHIWLKYVFSNNKQKPRSKNLLCIWNNFYCMSEQ